MAFNGNTTIQTWKYEKLFSLSNFINIILFLGNFFLCVVPGAKENLE